MRAYIDSNVIGTFNVMEAARKLEVRHLLMASTSSVYGANVDMPFKETAKADAQLTIYAATKKANAAHGACLRAFVGFAHDNVSFLHGLWALGPTGSGSLQIRRRDPQRPANRRL